MSRTQKHYRHYAKELKKLHPVLWEKHKALLNELIRPRRLKF